MFCHHRLPANTSFCFDSKLFGSDNKKYELPSGSVWILKTTCQALFETIRCSANVILYLYTPVQESTKQPGIVYKTEVRAEKYNLTTNHYHD